MNSSDSAKKPFVSVITPFYNTDAYLAECIESVLGQSYINFEYILVNNCSTDKSLEIAEHYAKLDSRIKVFSNENFLSMIDNYNCAIHKLDPKSKYSKVVQADDWIFKNCLLEMVELAEEYPTIGIVGSYGQLGNYVYCDGLPYASIFFSGRDACRSYLLEGIYAFGSQTSILMRSDLIRKRVPFYRDFGLFWDAALCFELLQDCDFGFVHQVLTFSRTENQSTRSRVVTYYYPELLQFMIMYKYGHMYLDEHEFSKRFLEIKKKYLSLLGKSFVFNRDKDFWKFHEDGLRSVGYKLSKLEMSKYVISTVLDTLFNFKNLIVRVLRRLSKK
jgi:glycosyltransferase involved in cell wall biosynthesis